MAKYKTLFKKMITKINYEEGNGYQFGELIQFNGMLHRPSKLRVFNWWDTFSALHPSMLSKYYFWLSGNFVAKRFSTWDLDIIITPKDVYVDDYSNEDALIALKNDLKLIIESSLSMGEPFIIDAFYSIEWEPWVETNNTQEFLAYANNPMSGFTIINRVTQHNVVTHDYSRMEPAPIQVIQDLFKRTTKRMSQKQISKYFKYGKFWADPILMNPGTSQVGKPILPGIPIANCNLRRGEVFVPTDESLQLKEKPRVGTGITKLNSNRVATILNGPYAPEFKIKLNEMVQLDGVLGMCVDNTTLKDNRQRKSKNVKKK
jgi:hypothetical protein